MIAAEQAVRDWTNAKAELVGAGNPLANGAYLLQQRSPADGAYAVITRSLAAGTPRPVAESDNPARVRMSAQVYAGTVEAAENAAAALATTWDALQGCPEPCGKSSHVLAVATDNLLGPMYMPTPADTGEPYQFMVSADFVLIQQ